MVVVDFRTKVRSFPFRGRAAEVIKRFSLTTYLHLIVRWVSCPFELLEEHIPSAGTVYELGCGHGLFLHHLASVRSSPETLCGVDMDRRKISFAQALNASPRLKFEVQDITGALELAGVSVVVLNDVLHLLPFAEQEKLLQSCFRQLPSSGVLLVKEIGLSGSWKYRWTQVQEFFVNRVFRWTIGDGFYCRSPESMTGLLARTGFRVETLPAHRGYPYAHMIYVCRKD